MPIWRTLARATTLAVLALALPAHAQVRVHGATTVAFGLMRPHQAEIEKLAGVQLTILPSSTSHGLADLVQGKADIAMLAEPFETIAAVLNQKQPGFVNLADFVGRHVADAHVQIIVHPSNSVKSLTNDQLRGLLSGKITNWAEVGGPDRKVLVVGEPTSSPHRMIKEALAIEYAPDLRTVQNANQTAVIVAQAPGAISYITTAHDLPIRDKLSFVNVELRLPLQLYVAYRKDAPERVIRVVEAAALLGKK